MTCCSPTAPIRGRPAASAARWSNELLSYEAIHGQHSFTDFYLANEEEIDRLLADTGASLADYPDRGIYSIDGSPWEIGEVVFDGKTPYVAFADFLNRLGGADLTDYAANADGRSLHWQLYGDDIRADETRVLLNGEAVELADRPLLVRRAALPDAG